MLRWILALLLIPFLDAVLLAVIVTQFGFVNWVGMVLLVVLTDWSVCYSFGPKGGERSGRCNARCHRGSRRRTNCSTAAC